MHADVDSLSAAVHYATISLFLLVLSEKPNTLLIPLPPYKNCISNTIIVMKDSERKEMAVFIIGFKNIVNFSNHHHVRQACLVKVF